MAYGLWPMDLGSPPTAAGFRIWHMAYGMLMCTQSAKCTAASNRSQQRAIRYIKGAEACGDPAALLSVPRKWQPFDVEQFSAVMQYSAGEMKRKLTTYREQCYEQGAPPSGRWAFWHAILKYVIERGATTQVDLTALILDP